MKEHRTRLHACSIERLGGLDCGGETYACGTYELCEATTSRHGEIVIYDDTGAINTTVCESGVLDMKAVKNMVCVALSSGGLALYRVVYGVDSHQVDLQLHISVFDAEEGLFLSLDIDNRLLETCWDSPTNIAVSTQQGSILVYEYIPPQSADQTSTLIKTLHVRDAHSMLGENMPAWIVFFDQHHKRRLISGGDDCVMKMWNLPENTMGTEDADECVPPDAPVATNRKAHTAGVTSGQWHPYMKSLFATGSYDEYVRIWDSRNLARPLLEIHTGGGVWRVKWYVRGDRSAHYLVLACMHSGCRVYRLDIQASGDDGDKCYSVTELDSAHHTDESNDKHLAYGIDVTNVQDNESTADFTIASCSFYDNLVQVWKCCL